MKRQGFTLVEILIVVFIVGIMAGFGLPSYVKTVERAKKRNAINMLKMIHASQVLYERRNNVYWPKDTTPHDTDAIEKGLLADSSSGDPLIDLDDDYSYFCNNTNTSKTQYLCTASRDACELKITQALLSDTNPSEGDECE